MKILIPTYRRTERQFTLRCIPRAWLAHTTLVCDEEDDGALRKYDVQRLVVPSKVRTIAQKREWLIREFAGEDILMLDDDLRFCRRDYTASPTFLRQATSDDVATMLDLVRRKLERGFAHVGISMRQGNNNLEATQRRRAVEVLGRSASVAAIIRRIRWEPNYRAVYALGYKTDVLIKNCKLGRIEHREDLDYTLQLLRAGFENRVLSEYCCDQQYAVGAGGAKLQRTVESSNADADKLARLHPGLVKVVDKEYLRSVPRKEVVCFWKKAFKEGRP